MNNRHADGHAHHHHHHEHNIDSTSLNTAFKLGIALNVGFVIVEGIFGFIYDSMGLLSDAGHNLSDVFALILSMVAFKLMSKKPDERHTYGYRKFSIQASLLNALLLFAAVGMILVESIDKLIHPTAVDGDAIAWVAGAGVIVNGVTAWLFLKDKEKDLNVKGAFLHMLADTLVSVGVVVAGIVIHYTGWYFIDPVIGIGIALMIGWSTWGLLAESFKLSIDSVPESIDMKDLEQDIQSVEGVRSIHHLHVWALSTTENAMTVHAVIES
ncbi:MAG: cation diffusion facilitator family transporter, partial [Muribaculaceae bacterium]|nr:cation diffusion facilitator family transporter [Muribaculaceae bacterium]